VNRIEAIKAIKEWPCCAASIARGRGLVWCPNCLGVFDTTGEYSWCVRCFGEKAWFGALPYVPIERLNLAEALHALENLKGEMHSPEECKERMRILREKYPDTDTCQVGDSPGKTMNA